MELFDFELIRRNDEISMKLMSKENTNLFKVLVVLSFILGVCLLLS